MSVIVEARIVGRVQGVAFRHWTKSRAEAHGLTGWVRNDISGAVVARLEGDVQQVHKMVEELWSGPGAASVRDVQLQAIKGPPRESASNRFEILY